MANINFGLENISAYDYFVDALSETVFHEIEHNWDASSRAAVKKLAEYQLENGFYDNATINAVVAYAQRNQYI